MKLAVVFTGQAREFALEAIYNSKRVFLDADFYYGVYEHEQEKLPPMNDTSNVLFFPEPDLPDGHIWFHEGRRPKCSEYERVLRDKVMVDWNRWDRRRHQSKQFYSHFYTTKHFGIHDKYNHVIRMRYDSIFDLDRVEEAIEYFKRCIEFDGFWGCQTRDGIADSVNEPINGVVRLTGKYVDACNDQIWSYPTNHFCNEDEILELYRKNLIPPVEWGMYRLATTHTGPESSGKVMSSILPYYKIGRNAEWLALREERLDMGLTT